MERLALVCFGSAIGGGLRYLAAQVAVTLLGVGFPYGTLFVNITGSFFISFIMHVGLETDLISPTTRLFLTTGVMGGLTTYSAFNFETLGLLRDGALLIATLNFIGTLVLCLVSGILGFAAGRAWVGG